MRIERENYTVVLEQPQLYVDNESRGRSGHMSHALCEFEKGSFIDFNSNCSALRWNGHSPYGWIEYRISRDQGKTYSEVQTLPYSVKSFLAGIYTISVEKAVSCEDGRIVAFCLKNDATNKYCCEPWHTPEVIISYDQGQTWSEPAEMSPYHGRIYDAVYHEGRIYVLHFCNPTFTGKEPENVYRIYVSDDQGESFRELCIVPFDTFGRAYGAMQFGPDGRLHVYVYNQNAEMDMDHAISDDCGETWRVLPPCRVEKGIRNPQVGLIDGVFVCHGRTPDKHFVLYTSEDGTNWDAGAYIVEALGPGAFYSNNLNLTDEKGNFLLIQYSQPYDFIKVNVWHINLRIERT